MTNDYKLNAKDEAFLAGRRGDWIQTYTGKQFFPLDPRPEDFAIEDIAHALSNTCRFAGHSLVFYSVAEHSVLVASLLTTEDALAGLMHDAAEAYIGDMPRPIKRGPGLEQYCKAEKEIERALAIRFNLSYPADGWSQEVKWADDLALAIEKKLIMADEPAPWGTLPDPTDYLHIPLGISPERAKLRFLETYYLLQENAK